MNYVTLLLSFYLLSPCYTMVTMGLYNLSPCYANAKRNARENFDFSFRLVGVPRWTRNHPLCMALNLLTCPMLVASRQLLFHKRLLSSTNTIIRSVGSSSIGQCGITANNLLQVRQEYGLMDMDLTYPVRADIINVFRAHLIRVVANRGQENLGWPGATDPG